MATARWERLEYGKYCQTPDGPIEESVSQGLAEHRQLGWSPGFPAALRPYCTPNVLGTQEHEMESVPEGWTHGVFMRPVFPSGASGQTLLGRVGLRLERPDLTHGRRYWLARYLVSDNHNAPADPFSGWAALESTPLQGLTRQEAHALAPLENSQRVAENHAWAGAFWPTAISYLISAVPVAFAEPVSERDFFTCVSLVWSALPLPLRRLLSAGWQVSSYFSGKLAITATASAHSLCATFAPGTQSWSAPASVLLWQKGQPQTRDFFPHRLRPGEAYHNFLLEKSASAAWPAGASAGQALNLSHLEQYNFQELPDWQDLLTVRAVRSIGLQAQDYQLLAALQDYLTGNLSAPPPLNQLQYDENKRRFYALLPDALARPEQRASADVVFWQAVAETVPPFLAEILETDGPGKERARLLSLLAQQQSEENFTGQVLAAFQRAALQAEAEDLPREARAELERHLEISLEQPPLAQHHAALLAAEEITPRFYREWATTHSTALLKVSAFNDPALYSRLASLSGETLPYLMGLLRCGEKLDKDSKRALKSLPAADGDDLRTVFLQEWARTDNETASRRERLLTWRRLFQGQEEADPLLRLALRQRLGQKQIKNLNADAAQGYVPQSLEIKVAALALAHWESLGRQATSAKQQWSYLTRHWPAAYAQFFGVVAPPDVAAAAPIVIKAIDKLLVPFRDLDETWESEIQTHSADRQRAAAPLIWKLAQRNPLSPEITSFTELCQPFEQGEWPPVLDNKPYTVHQLTSLIDLAREVHEQDTPGRLDKVAAHLWQTAKTDWQLVLLLGLYPQRKFQPRVENLGRLVPYRAWLLQHLNGQVHAQRSQLFAPALWEFHSRPYMHHDESHKKYIQDPVLWAAFRGVPLSFQPKTKPLLEIIRLYGSSIAGYKDEAEGAEMCATYFRPYKTQPAGFVRDARERVVKEFVEPLLKGKMHPKEIWPLLEEIKNLRQSHYRKSGSLALNQSDGYESLGKPRNLTRPFYELLTELALSLPSR